MLRWPDAQAVDQAVRRWAERVGGSRPGVVRIGYFGSYARGDWGVGSDLDLIIVVEASDEPFMRRAAAWDTAELPVPADVLVYTRAEWQARGSRRHPPVQPPIVWIWERDARS